MYTPFTYYLYHPATKQHYYGVRAWNAGTKGLVGSWNKGRERTKEHRKKISKTLTGRTFNRRNSNMCVEYWTSRGHSEDYAKEQISLIAKTRRSLAESKKRLHLA